MIRTIRKRWLAAATLPLLAVGALAINAGSSAQAAPPGWTEVWSDQFDGAAGQPLDPSKWVAQLGTSYPGGAPQWGTWQVDTATNDRKNSGLTGDGKAHITPTLEGGKWYSARLETVRTDFAPPAGGVLRMEAVAKLPDVSGAEARGYWPAFWALGGPARGNGATNWPGVGEIDILEQANGIDANWATLHCGTWTDTDGGGVCGEPSGISSGQRNASDLGLTSLKTNFHTYAVEWDTSTSPQELRWYIDNVKYHTVKADQVPTDVWTKATNHGYFMILDVAMGGGLATATGGGPAPTTKPGVPFLIDSVSVLSRPAGSVPPPTSTTTPTGSATSSGTSGGTSTATATATNACPPPTTVTATSTGTATVTSSPTTTTAASTPLSNLRLAGTTNSSLTLAWDGTASATYDILRSGVKIASVTGNTFTDIGLLPNTPYIYSIRSGSITTPEQTFTIK